jgi:S-adenosylmethionine decarboxylase
MKLGKHCFTSLYECDRRLIDDENYLITLLEESAKMASATVIETISKKFDPQGVTVLTLLSESHISIHTWPESGSAAVDVFTCGEVCDPLKAVMNIIQSLRPVHYKIDSVER